jgi:hypothetical protein
MKRLWPFASLLFILMPMLVTAHEGHGSTEGFTVTHYFVEPEHFALPLLLIAGMAFLVIRMRKVVEKD